MTDVEKHSAIELIEQLETELNEEHKGAQLPEKMYERLRNRFRDLLTSLFSNGTLDFLPTGMQISYDNESSSIAIDYAEKEKKTLKEAEELDPAYLLPEGQTRFWVSWTGSIKERGDNPTPYTIWKLTQTDGEKIYFALIDTESAKEIHAEIPKMFDKCKFLFIIEKPGGWEPDRKSFYWVSKIKTNLYGDEKKDDKS